MCIREVLITSNCIHVDEILFEYKFSESTIKCTKNDVRNRITMRLASLGVPNAILQLTSSSSGIDGNNFILQRYSSKWDTFVDVDQLEALCDGDRLSVVPVPSSAEETKKCHGEKAADIISKVKKPTKAEAKALATYFPSSSSHNNQKSGFDPLAECVVKGNQLKEVLSGNVQVL